MGYSRGEITGRPTRESRVLLLLLLLLQLFPTVIDGEGRTREEREIEREESDRIDFFSQALLLLYSCCWKKERERESLVFSYIPK